MFTFCAVARSGKILLADVTQCPIPLQRVSSSCAERCGDGDSLG